METTVLTGPMKRLVTWLGEEGIEYEIHEHDRSFTAWDTAVAEGVSPRTFAKVVWVRSARGGDAMLALDAEDHLDLGKARGVLQSGRVSLVPEDEIEALAPDCEPGAMPAVGRLFGLPTYADRALREAAEISFNAGSHAFAVRVDRRAWAEALGVIYADLKVDTGFVTPWSGA